MHIDDVIEDKAATDGSFAIAYAILQLARAQKDTAIAIRNLDVSRIAEGVERAGEAVGSAIINRDG